jgi:hypothetical protein
MTRIVRLAAARARAAGRAPGAGERPVVLAPAAPVSALDGAPGYGTGGGRALTAAARSGGPGDPPSRSGLAPRAEGRGQDGILR